MGKVPELIVALDYSSIDSALAMVDQLGDFVHFYKVGKELFTVTGPDIIIRLKERRKKVFLDLKFHDIPNTVGRAVKAGIEWGVDMINVHTMGGRAMLEAAVAAARESRSSCFIIGVTVLTSMDQSALHDLGIQESPAELVVRLAKLAKESGLDGVVASAHEASLIRETCGPNFLRVVPGIRPVGSAKDDQKRVMTPFDAAQLDIEYIVIGRPITHAPNPVGVVQQILDEIKKNDLIWGKDFFDGAG